jgi:hypothetical protein
MFETGYCLRLIKDVFAAGAATAAPLPALNRVLYCNAGGFSLASGETRGPDEAWHGAGAATVTAGPDGAEIWRWELAPLAAKPALKLGRGIRSSVSISEPVTTLDPAVPWLMRCDSVKFPPGGCAFLHSHQGPGIRCLRDGAIRIDACGASHQHAPGEAWFENGPDPVFAQAGTDGCSRFIRVMLLPRELKGKSSIRYVNADDLEKPKSQQYKGYVDEHIEH